MAERKKALLIKNYWTVYTWSKCSEMRWIGNRRSGWEMNSKEKNKKWIIKWVNDLIVILDFKTFCEHEDRNSGHNVVGHLTWCNFLLLPESCPTVTPGKREDACNEHMFFSNHNGVTNFGDVIEDQGFDVWRKKTLLWWRMTILLKKVRELGS